MHPGMGLDILPNSLAESTAHNAFFLQVVQHQRSLSSAVPALLAATLASFPVPHILRLSFLCSSGWSCDIALTKGTKGKSAGGRGRLRKLLLPDDNVSFPPSFLNVGSKRGVVAACLQP